MLVKSLSVFAISAFAAQAAAAKEAKPYKLEPLHQMSVRDLFGVVRRQSDSGSTSGYQPSQSVCANGTTCAQACGNGFETCASSDNAVHCFNPAGKQTCCPDHSGNSCDAGFFCAQDTARNTWCCPDALDLPACAAAYTVTGGLARETATATAASFSPTLSSSSFVANTTRAPNPSTGSSSGNHSSTPASVPAVTTTTWSIPTLPPTTSSSPLPSSAGGAVSATGSFGALVLVAGALVALV